MVKHKTKLLPVLSGCVLTLLPALCVGQGLQVAAGTNLVLDGANIHLVVNDGGIRNDGVVTSGLNTNIDFLGTAATAQSQFSGSGTTQAYNLDIDKALNDVRLNSTLVVEGTVNMISGRLILNGQTLDLKTTGFINNEGPTSYISGILGGQIIRKTVMTAPAAFNPGNIGLEVTSAANLGNVTLRRRYQQFQVSPTDMSIRRYYEVEADNQTGLNADIKVYYLAEDLAPGANENDLFVWSSTNNGLNWNFKSKNSNDPVLKYVAKSGIDTLKWVTLSTPNTPLPLNLLSFNAALVQGEGVLTWVTTSERNVQGFEIEHAPDGKSFSRLGVVESKGVHGGAETYTFTDRALWNGNNYYRLKIMDNDGQFAYSSIEMLRLDGYKNELLSIYPNPAAAHVSVTLSSNNNNANSLLVYDVTGKLVMSKEANIEKGINQLDLDLGSLVDGTYLLKFSQSGFGTTKIVKKGQ